MAGSEDLFDHINKSGVSCLNENPDHPVGSLFGLGGDFLESDADEELLISIPFHQKVKIYGVELKGPSNGQQPSSLKFFAPGGTAQMSFDDVHSLPGLHEETLKWEPDGDGVRATLRLRVAKFQSISTLCIFVPNNVGGTETTVITSLRLNGVPEGERFKWDPQKG